MIEMQEAVSCYNCFEPRQANIPCCPYCGYNNADNQEQYPMALPAGTLLVRRYLIGRVLGQGGFGITYLALDLLCAPSVKVAIKEYLPEGLATRIPGNQTVHIYAGERQESFRYGAERFLEEARMLAKFNGNPGIAGVRHYFVENNTAYFAMDFVEGISFKRYLQYHNGRIDAPDALRILLPVMDALSDVHREGLIHRDVAPDNIYITRDGRSKLLDFGSARYSLGNQSQSLDVILRQGYAPMEQYYHRGRQGPYTDVYSVAACFYASITGYLPPESLERIEQDTLKSFSERNIQLPRQMEAAIWKGLSVRAADRFQTMEEFKAALTADLPRNKGTEQEAKEKHDEIKEPEKIIKPMEPEQPIGGKNRKLIAPNKRKAFLMTVGLMLTAAALLLILLLTDSL